MPNLPDLTDSVNQVYTRRNDFILIGLTGRTGSGCSSTANLLTKDINNLKLPKPYENGLSGNELRKYRIAYNFAKKNWKPFKVIKVTNLITSFLLDYKTNENFYKFIVNYFNYKKDSKSLINIEKIEEDEFKNKFNETFNSYKDSKFESLKDIEFDKIIKTLNKIKSELNSKNTQNKIYFYENYLSDFKKLIKFTLKKYSPFCFTNLYQSIGDSIRATGFATYYECKNYSPDKIFTLAEKIKECVEIYEKDTQTNETYIVIDCLRNPFEALYFREIYSAFYLMALNTPDNQRVGRLHRKLNLTDLEIFQLDEKEYNGKKQGEQLFVSQNIQNCYDIADIHIHNPQIGEKDFSLLKKGLATYISLIQHPGLITPTSMERCMQIAHVSKSNSGCLSRKVGAVITDKYFSIKAVGWNDVPKGQTPCILRNVESLLNHDDKDAYSYYEKNDCDFREELEEEYSFLIKQEENKQKEKIKKNLNGRNICFCFKDIQNGVDQKGNQVHTRALHGEENAFLQIVKYGGQAINGGYLFTTSSPCELCAKKAYQLGITKIFYIDPYPGLSNKHILLSGSSTPDLQLFNGAIGRAYHQLYEPIMPYKDELELLGLKNVKNKIKHLYKENKKKEKELLRLISEFGYQTKMNKNNYQSKYEDMENYLKIITKKFQKAKKDWKHYEILFRKFFTE